MFFIFFIYVINSLPSFYHTTHQINREIDHLLTDCHNAIKKYHTESEITTIHFNKHSKFKKSFIIFGEHARELISVETGLNFLKHICHQDKFHHNLILIINMNPRSRKYVELGHYCLRENINGVDLNRNYDFQWTYEVDHQVQNSSGENPFSEYETEIVRNILHEFKPDLFISVHSGALALLTPWAYKYEEVDMDIKTLHQMKDQHCKACLLGGAAQRIGYTAGGCSMDYAYGKAKVPTSYTFEIYSHLFGLIYKEPDSNYMEFLQIKDKVQVGTKELDCFKYFNPTTEQKYEQTLRRWTTILSKLLA